MKYRMLSFYHMGHFSEALENAAKEEYSVISSGCTFDPLAGQNHWWAILEKTPAVVELEKPKDEAAGLLEAARKIAKICKERDNCIDCPFANECDVCRLMNGCGIAYAPEKWPIAREG